MSEKSEQPINATLIESLYQNSLIDEQTRRAGHTFIAGPRQWLLWTERLTLTLATSLILASVMFFIAYNWYDMSKWFKFILVETAILMSLITALYPFKSKLINQTAGFAASFFTGVLLALIGQTYQTGADAWQLFALWSLLILPWVTLSKFAPHWALWLIVTNIGLGLWMQQTIDLPQPSNAFINAAAALLNGTALGALLIARPKHTWLQNPWILRLLSLAVIYLLAQIAIEYISRSGGRTLWFSAIALITMVTQAALFYLSRFKWKDFIIHALLVISLAIQFEFLMIKAISDVKLETASFTVAAMITIALFALLITYLRSQYQTMEATDDQPNKTEQ